MTGAATKWRLMKSNALHTEPHLTTEPVIQIELVAL
jgi:hypothetical protein